MSGACLQHVSRGAHWPQGGADRGGSPAAGLYLRRGATGRDDAELRRRHTKAFARYALELSRHMTIQDVASHLGVGRDPIKQIQKQDLQRLFGRRKLKQLRQIAIDEISIGVVQDLDKLHKDVLKGTRWLLLKNPENLDPQRNEPQRLEEALRLNSRWRPPTTSRKTCGDSGSSRTNGSPRTFLTSWYLRARASGIRVMQQMAKTLAAHRKGCWPTTTIRSRPVRWRGPTTRSRPCNAKPIPRPGVLQAEDLLAIHETKYSISLF